MTATAVVVTASMLRQTQLHLSSTVVASASIVKRINKSLTATVSAIGSMVATFQGIVIGPFAASVAMAEIVAPAAAVVEPVQPAASASDAAGVIATPSEVQTTTVSVDDQTGARVVVVERDP